MIKAICRWWYRTAGWTVDFDYPKEVERCVLLGVPHTSNYDAWLMLGAFSLLKISIRFAIKKEWIRFPFKRLFLNVGALGIDRSPRVPGEERPSMVEVMADLFTTHEKLTLVIAPEGSRSLRTQWKSGFYWIAKEAGVPIALAYLDYATKSSGVGKIIYPTDYEKDMREIMEFYKDKTARYPEKFSVDTNFL